MQRIHPSRLRLQLDLKLPGQLLLDAGRLLVPPGGRGGGSGLSLPQLLEDGLLPGFDLGQGGSDRLELPARAALASERLGAAQSGFEQRC